MVQVSIGGGGLGRHLGRGTVSDFRIHGCGDWRGIPAVLAHGYDVEGIMECVVPGRAANPRDETLPWREEGTQERGVYVYLRQRQALRSIANLARRSAVFSELNQSQRSISLS